jgi:TRAP-type transport system small permease protein
MAILDRLVRHAAVVLLLALLASVITGVVSRQIGRPAPWSDEMAQHLLVWTGFAGWVIAARRRSHIRITVFIDRLPQAARVALECIIQLAVIGFALAMLRWGWPLVPRNWDVEWVSLPLPGALLYLPVPFAAAVLIAQAMADIRLAVAGHVGGGQAPGGQPL